MPTFNSRGVSLYYEVHGAGRPVVLIHGFASSFARNWLDTRWVRFLNERGFQVVGPEIRGHGRSEKFYSPAEYTTPQLAGDVLNLLDHLEIASADLVGFSMGGAIALHLGMHHPERVGRIVAGGISDAVLRDQQSPLHVAEIRAALLAPDPAQIGSPLGRLFRDFAERGNNDLQALAALMAGPGWPGEVVELRPLNRPLLIVQAAEDQFMRGREGLAAAFPEARFLTIPDRNHNSVVGHARFKEAAAAFLLEDSLDA
jgi:pimeloyl-ACP methyl ester carboxylesterase